MLHVVRNLYNIQYSLACCAKSIYSLWILCEIHIFSCMLFEIYTYPCKLCKIFKFPSMLCKIYIFPFMFCEIYAHFCMFCKIYKFPWMLCEIYIFLTCCANYTLYLHAVINLLNLAQLVCTFSGTCLADNFFHFR